MQKPIAIVVLGAGAIDTAKKIQALYSHAVIYGLQTRVVDADKTYSDFGATLRELYRADTTIIALCAAGIVIRTLAPLLANKDVEPPVLAVAEDGSAVVPLLGGLGGVNNIAREISAALGVAAAITTSGELRFGTCLLNPPRGYVLADIEQGKRFVADLLGGKAVRIEGAAPWLDAAELPIHAEADDSGQHTIRITTAALAAHAHELVIYSRCAAFAVGDCRADLIEVMTRMLRAANIAEAALGCIVAAREHMSNVVLQRAAAHFNVSLRFIAVPDITDAESLLIQTGIGPLTTVDGDIALAVASEPLDIDSIGSARGRLTVIGLGPGAVEFMVPAAKTALAAAEDILGYETYVNMAGPFRADQTLHCSDNREELQRARHAFELAAAGRTVVVVSSGDPGVFAMAAAVLEALEASSDNGWHAVELQIFPGVSAALATAALAGAPLGHDFCVISLSDNLKPWSVIETRLQHAVAADFALAFYNPISRARPWQLGRALDIIKEQRNGATLVVLGRDIGRPAETLTTTTLAELRAEQVDMRTLVIIGSSTTRSFARADGGCWVYTPRWYDAPN
jgi:cobalt-precorrin 5A hydrolase/precorrin-3B C17-methyltransferase